MGNVMSKNDPSPTDFMSLALAAAHEAAGRGEVPVGAVLVHTTSQRVLAMDGNRVEERKDPTAHAEMLVIQQASRSLGSPRLDRCDLYVTLEPCPMCATAISFARLRRVYFGAFDPKGGGVDHGPQIFHQLTCHHAPEVYGGISEDDSSQILKAFFQARR